MSRIWFAFDEVSKVEQHSFPAWDRFLQLNRLYTCWAREKTHALMICTSCCSLNSGDAAPCVISCKNCSPLRTASNTLNIRTVLKELPCWLLGRFLSAATEGIVPLFMLCCALSCLPHTGEHPTTRLCLKFLLQQRQALEGKRLMDYGSGSGVLAIAALKFGAVAVVSGRTVFDVTE